MATPSEREAFFLVEEGRLVGFYFLENGAHEYLSDEPTAVGDPVFVAETIQGSLLILIEKDGDFMFAGCFSCHFGLEIECEFEAGGDEVSSGFLGERNVIDDDDIGDDRLLELSVRDECDGCAWVELTAITEIKASVDTTEVISAQRNSVS